MNIVMNEDPYICSSNNVMVYEKKSYENYCGTEHKIKIRYVYENKEMLVGEMYSIYTIKDNILDIRYLNVSSYDIFEALLKEKVISLMPSDISNPCIYHVDPDFYNWYRVLYALGLETADPVTLYIYQFMNNDDMHIKYIEMYSNLVVTTKNGSITNIFDALNNIDLNIITNDFQKREHVNDYHNKQYYFREYYYLKTDEEIDAVLVEFDDKLILKIMPSISSRIRIITTDFKSNKFVYNMKTNNTFEEITFVNETQYNNILFNIENRNRKKNYNNNRDYGLDFENYNIIEWNLRESVLKSMCDVILNTYLITCKLNLKECIRQYINAPFRIQSEHDNKFMLYICDYVTIIKYYFEESMCYSNIKIDYEYNDIIHTGYLDKNTKEIFDIAEITSCKDHMYFAMNNTLYYISKYNNYTLQKINESNIILINNNTNNIIISSYDYNNSMYKSDDIYDDIVKSIDVIDDVTNYDPENENSDSSTETIIDYLAKKCNDYIIKLHNLVNSLSNYMSKIFVYILMVGIIFVIILFLIVISKIIGCIRS